MAINQNVPTCVASGTNNGCRPNPTYANNSQYSSAARLDLPRAARVAVAAAGGLGPLPRLVHALEGENNVGEFFFSSPIDPFDLSKDWGRSDDDQRHRLVVNGVGPHVAEPARRSGSSSPTASR